MLHPGSDPESASPESAIRSAPRGQLKIFLGYAAGVGKTYAMLEAALQRKEEGRDVVIGIVDTHGRKETAALAASLDRLPVVEIEHNGQPHSELDLDGLLARRPGLALVDDLAHSNVIGMRHPKRYLDVMELLEAGINVYATINIQHLESLNDLIQQITGVAVSDTVPDRILDEADEIELVDLPSDELLQRLKEGKVYVPDQALRTIEKIYRKGNLTALREIAMRRAATRVDDQMRTYMHARAIPGPWPAGERILVSISSHPLAERLIRAGRRLSDEIGAEWFVLFVETPGHLAMPQENRDRIQHNLSLAESLGARVFRVPGTSVTDEILDFCHEHNITKIVAGRPQRKGLPLFFQRSVLEEILRRSGGVDVYVITEDQQNLEPVSFSRWLPHRPIHRYFFSIALVVLTTLVGIVIFPFLEPTNLEMLYLASVVIAALYFGRGPAMLNSFLGVLEFDFMFIEPRYTLNVSDTQYIITFIGLLAVGLIISNLASLLRDQVDALRNRERQTQALNRFSGELTGAVNLEDVLGTIQRNLLATFSCETATILPEHSGLTVRGSSPSLNLSEEDLAVADWCYQHGQMAGQGTNTLAGSALHFVPLVTARGVVGVLGLRLQNGQTLLESGQRTLLEGFANLSALAVERARFAEEALQAEKLRSTERLQTALLNSISHQFRTPLSTITGVLTSLAVSENASDEQFELDPKIRMELLDTATNQANHLNRLVENLLEMTRLEAGAVKARREAFDLADLIGAVMEQLPGNLCDRPVSIQIPQDFPNLMGDSTLTSQVLINLVENACKYSPATRIITIAAQSTGPFAEISVRDEGPGIPDEYLETVFEKFFRITRSDQPNGSGLGLSICKGLVEAQGGRIWARNNPGAGATFTFTLPVEQA
ncbi:MAG: sensor histidine kinase KdpD [Anaerolineae bacterium]|nr:sensor histidine kinase KdpD [Anaerolineae bacterium]